MEAREEKKQPTNVERIYFPMVAIVKEVMALHADMVLR